MELNIRCYICDAVLSAEEVHFNRKYKDEKYGPYDPCGRCLAVIDEAFEDPLEETEIDFLLSDEEGYEIDEEILE